MLNRIGNGRLTYFEVTGNVRLVVPAGGSTLPAPMAPLLQVAPLARVRRRLQVLKKSRGR